MRTILVAITYVGVLVSSKYGWSNTAWFLVGVMVTATIEGALNAFWNKKRDAAQMKHATSMFDSHMKQLKQSANLTPNTVTTRTIMKDGPIMRVPCPKCQSDYATLEEVGVICHLNPSAGKASDIYQCAGCKHRFEK